MAGSITPEQARAELERRKAAKTTQAASPKPSAEQARAELERRKSGGDRTVMDKLTGEGGDRYQLWPERVARGMFDWAKENVEAPGKFMRGEMPVRDEQGNLSDQAIGWGLETGLMASPASPAFRAKMPPHRLAAGQAAQRQNIELPRAVMGGTSARMTGQALQGMPWVGTPLKQAQQRAYSQVDDAARAAAQRAGSGDVVGAGEALKQGIRQTATETIPGAVSREYDEVGKLVDPNYFTPLVSTGRVADVIKSQRKNAALSGDGSALGMVREALSRPQGMNYEGIKNLRTAIGEMLDNPSALVAAGMSKSELKRIYGALSDDLAAAVKNGGGEGALAQFEIANAMSRKGNEIREALQSVVGKTSEKSDEAIIGYIQRIAGSNNSANIKALRRVRAAAGDSWDEVASAIVTRMGRDKRGDFSPTRFLSDYDSLSAEGKALLFNNVNKGELRSALVDIAAVSRQLDDYAKSENFSKTGNVIALVAAGVSATFSIPATLTAALGARGAAQYLSKPTSARAVAGWAKAYAAAAKNPTPGNMQVLNAAAKNLVLKYGAAQGPTREAAKMIEQLSGGAIKGVADPEGQGVPNGNPIPNGGPNQQLMDSYRQRPFGPNDA